MKTFILSALLVLSASVAFAQPTVVQPMFPEWAAGQGGTYQNPYQVYTPDSRTPGTFGPMFPDPAPGYQNRLSPGSYNNPYVYQGNPYVPSPPRGSGYRYR